MRTLQKEKTAWDLIIALRAKNKINTPGPPFETLNDQKINTLIIKGAIKIIQYNPIFHNGRLWKIKLMRKIKGQTSA